MCDYSDRYSTKNTDEGYHLVRDKKIINCTDFSRVPHISVISSEKMPKIRYNRAPVIEINSGVSETTA